MLIDEKIKMRERSEVPAEADAVISGEAQPDTEDYFAEKPRAWDNEWYTRFMEARPIQAY